MGFTIQIQEVMMSAKLLNEVKEITPELEECAGGAGSNLGTGGMITKLTAAKTATKCRSRYGFG